MIIEEDFKNWTSGNRELNKIIRQSQLNAKKLNHTFLEVIPFKFGQIKKIGSGGFSTIYLGNFSGSRYNYEDRKNWEPWKVSGISNRVVLKSFFESNIITNLIKELEVNSKLHGDFTTKCFGVTQNPDDGQYMIVMEYAAHGDLRRYLQDPETLINWKYIIYLSRWIIRSLCKIHERGFIHKDFHTGNILIDHTRQPSIADMGLTFFINEKSDEVIGIMPYIAPEVFRFKLYTTAVDIYSFAMIMWEFSSQQPPFGKIAHDYLLEIEICKEHRRPTIVSATPQCWIDLMQQCWDANPGKRPTAMQVFQKLDKWYRDFENNIWSDDINNLLCVMKKDINLIV
ncbi:hypothetical protein RclHR1_12310002 [Rhizophagus clarus]|uniref:Protein kinase domain-containing protein n=1 Tax=Rhizophagus clarus TaxID=94130 RepID=A0A2Z6QJA3_9GLOM|nr:hypothetical protein RclHR1_12310002 [Rhizophagus clarus]